MFGVPANTPKFKALELTEFIHKGEHVTLYEGKFKKPGGIAKRRGSQNRIDPTTGKPGTRLESQIRKDMILKDYKLVVFTLLTQLCLCLRHFLKEKIVRQMVSLVWCSNILQVEHHCQVNL